jgi:hypothetical protein
MIADRHKCEAFENLVRLSIIVVLSNFSENPDKTIGKFGIESKKIDTTGIQQAIHNCF